MKQSEYVLLAGRKLSAVEACNYGLVTEVFPHAEFEREVNKRMRHLAALPPKVSVLGRTTPPTTLNLYYYFNSVHTLQGGKMDFFKEILTSYNIRIHANISN